MNETDLGFLEPMFTPLWSERVNDQVVVETFRVVGIFS
jgi:hypothetical protein